MNDIQDCKSCGGKIHDGTTEHVVCPVCQQSMSGVVAESHDLGLSTTMPGTQSEGTLAVPEVSGEVSEVPVLGPEALPDLPVISEEDLRDFENAE